MDDRLPTGEDALVAPHILIIEDDHEMLKMLERLLRHAPYTLMLALSASQALAILQETAPDLILLDLAMPGITGIDILRYVRAAEHLQPCKVIVITARPQMLPAAAKYGYDGVLMKPLHQNDLLQLIADVLQQRE